MNVLLEFYLGKYVILELLPCLRFPRSGFRLAAIRARLATLCQYEGERFP